MIIPSIDLMQGQAVQLIGGKEPSIEAGDPFVIAEKWSKVGPLAVIDLDAALGKGNHREIISGLCRQYRCRVGGGIRDLETAQYWLNAGAEQIIIGTAATPEFVQALPKERVIVALDAFEDEVVVEGWTTKTGLRLEDQLPLLAPYVSGFLITFVEKEGRMEGTRLDRVPLLVELAGDARITIAGGITTAEEIRQLDQMEADAQVGMALYTQTLGLAEGFCAPFTSDREDGLWPTVVVDEGDRALGLCYSNLESVRHALEQGKGIYWSRKRGLWIKGKSSGHTQALIQIDVDCDRDTLRFKVRQEGPGFCHLDTKSCWGKLGGVSQLFQTLHHRRQESEEGEETQGSYTQRLFNEKGLLEAKILEEAQELTEAHDPQHCVEEFADVLYFASVALVRSGKSWEDVERILDQRAQKVSRRKGDRKDLPSSSLDSASTLKVYPFHERPDQRHVSLDPKVLKRSKKIVDLVQNKGVSGLQQAIAKYENRTPSRDELVISPQQLEQAYLSLDKQTQSLLERVSHQIRSFAQAQKGCFSELSCSVDGGEAGHVLAPVQRAACYAPGGRFPLPSSVLMTAISAQVAGVEEIWVVSPSADPIIWACAWLAQAKGVIYAGGAHAVSAVAYGCDELIPRCDLIVGPGNEWVTAAKFWVSKDIGIDMLAGPSELLVLADESASPDQVAADLLAQAEHDPKALPVLVSTSSSLIERVNHALQTQLISLSTREIASQALNTGYAILCSSTQEMIQCANELASEHLEVSTHNPETLLPHLKQYGGLFIGEETAEVFGDYGMGPNHVLPTGRTARWTGGLSVFTFLRVRTWLKGDRTHPEYNRIVQDTETLALLEGLSGHAYSASLRQIDEHQIDERQIDGD